VRGRPNVAWTKSEYERLTRNGYNLVRIYDNFEQAMAWLRRQRRKYRLNNPNAPDVDWSTSEDDEDPEAQNPDSANRRDQDDRTHRSDGGGDHQQAESSNCQNDISGK
jgi:hypothetical protein